MSPQIKTVSSSSSTQKLVIDKMAADFSEQKLLSLNSHIMKRKGAFKSSVIGNRHFNGSVNGNLKLKIAKCSPFKIYISNEMT